MRDGSSDYSPASAAAAAGLISGMVSGKPPPLQPARSPVYRFSVLLVLFVSTLYFVYTMNLLVSSSRSTCSSSSSSFPLELTSTLSSSAPIEHPPPPPPPPPPPDLRPPAAGAATGLRHVVFGIAASARLWSRRREYIKVWWQPGRMRGYVWLDKKVWEPEAAAMPEIRVSANTSRFPYTHRLGSRSAIRISRIVSETLRLLGPRDKSTRWLVMGDDDTVFVPDNLIRVLSKLDHTQPYYIGSVSESHLQNVYFSYNMAYGGGGFAISRPLAAELERFQDRCITRYPALYGSDDRIQACMAELGVPLTRHPGFHQYDVYGDLLGLLAAHPVVPLVSLHHLDIVQPVFPDAANRSDALRRLYDGPVRLDSAAVMQQSICYDKRRGWTLSIAWGYTVHIIRGLISPREMEIPTRTFLNWYRRADFKGYAFNTRPVTRNPCQRPFVYYLSSASADRRTTNTVTTYSRRKEKHPICRWKTADPSSEVDAVVVHKKPDPSIWDRAPRRNCCRVTKREKKTIVVDVGLCRRGEISEF